MYVIMMFRNRNFYGKLSKLFVRIKSQKPRNILVPKTRLKPEWLKKMRVEVEFLFVFPTCARAPYALLGL